VSADTAVEALQKTETALAEDHFKLVAVHWLANRSFVDWDDVENRDAAECADEAARSGNVVYARFDSWAHEDGKTRNDPSALN
jgi:hypothetical protein